MEYLNEYKKWCTSDVFDEETKKELINIKNDNKEIDIQRLNDEGYTTREIEILSRIPKSSVSRKLKES